MALIEGQAVTKSVDVVFSTNRKKSPSPAFPVFFRRAGPNFQQTFRCFDLYISQPTNSAPRPISLLLFLPRGEFNSPRFSQAQILKEKSSPFVFLDTFVWFDLFLLLVLACLNVFVEHDWKYHII